MDNRIHADVIEEVASDKDRIQLAKKIRTVFSTYNRMRAVARNSMWLGLVCLVASALARFNPLDDAMGNWNQSQSMCFLTGVCFAINSLLWYVVRTGNFAIYACITAAVCVATGIEDLAVGSDFKTAKLVGFLILC